MNATVVLIQLVLWALFAYLTYKTAESNGRDPRVALLWGILFGIWAWIAYLIIGKPPVKHLEK